MKDYFGKHRDSTALGIVTMKQFEDAYREMSNSPDKLPVASNIIPVFGANGSSLFKQVIKKDAQGNDMTTNSGEVLYNAIIFWETTGNNTAQEKPHAGPDVPLRKKLEID